MISVKDVLSSFSLIFEKPIQQFPGNLPVSLEQQQITELNFGYLCSLKADGERVFLMILENGDVYRVTRKMEIIKLAENITLNHLEAKWFLFDAEYVSTSKSFFVFDTIVFASKSVCHREIGERIELAKYFISKLIPLPQLKKLSSELHRLSTPSQQPFARWTVPKCLALERKEPLFGYQVEVKPFFFMGDLHKVWSLRSMVSYSVDGMIFVRRCCSYEPFRTNPMALIKWKPEITIDFQASEECDTSPETFYQFTDPRFRPFCQTQQGNMTLLFTLFETRQKFSLGFSGAVQIRPNDIVECAFRNGCWYVLQVRYDKISPNTLETIERSLKSIMDHITLEDIVPA